MVVAVGYVLFEGLLLGLRGEAFERSIPPTMGLSMVLQNGAVFLFTTNPHLLESKLSYQNIVVGDFRMPPGAPLCAGSASLPSRCSI